jgi:hypothetical protein
MSVPITKSSKPYAVVGAGHFVSMIWKHGDEDSGWKLRFNIFRLSQVNGRTSRLFSPGDVVDLAKLCQVLAATFVDDGCISASLRQQLQDLEIKLDAITSKEL